MRRVLILAAAVALLPVSTVFAGSGPGIPPGGGPIGPEGSGTIMDGQAVFTWNGFGVSNFDNSDFTWRGTTDHMFENTWYFRVAGDTDESVLGPPDGSVFAGNVATFDWADVNSRGLFSALVVSTVVDGGGHAVAQVTHVLTVTNISGSPLDIDIFAYLDLDLTNTSTEDEGALLSDPDLIEQFDTSTRFEFNGPSAIEFQVTDTQGGTSLRTLFTDGMVTDLDGTGLPFGPADMEAGFQWMDMIGAGGSASFTRVETITESEKVPVELMSFEIE